MKKLILVLLICTLALTLTACATFQEAFREAMSEMRETGYDIRGNSTHPEYLVGTWLWHGSPYYVFSADGTGYMVDNPLFWGVNADGQLLLCITIGLCGDLCNRPSSWNFEVDGDNLTLRGRLVTYNYTRQ